MLDGLYQLAAVFFIPYLVWSLGLPTSWNGSKGIDSLADFSTTVGIAAIFAANTYVGMNAFNLPASHTTPRNSIFTMAIHHSDLKERAPWKALGLSNY